MMGEFEAIVELMNAKHGMGQRKGSLEKIKASHFVDNQLANLKDVFLSVEIDGKSEL